MGEGSPPPMMFNQGRAPSVSEVFSLGCVLVEREIAPSEARWYLSFGFSREWRVEVEV